MGKCLFRWFHLECLMMVTCRSSRSITSRLLTRKARISDGLRVGSKGEVVSLLAWVGTLVQTFITPPALPSSQLFG